MAPHRYKPTHGPLVVLGIMGRAPFAGVAWQTLHYLEGFRRLGYDVYYVEDTDAWPYDPEQNAITADCGYTVRYLAELMGWCGLPDRWAYRAPAAGERFLGLSEQAIANLFRRAVGLVNLTGATVLHDAQLRVPVRIYLETDPVQPQVLVAGGDAFTIARLDAHTHHFTYGENLGAADCGVPVGRVAYRPTRQPIILDWWPAPPAHGDGPPPGCFTTIGNWRQTGQDLAWLGETYTWSKHLEFLKFLALPQQTPACLELALAGSTVDEVRLLEAHGWRVADALAVSRAIGPYRDYICGSRGEFTVAKDQNVRLRSGWFSDRSACYLAAGRPVITQETGFSNILPTGEGLFAFTTMDDILAALAAIGGDYQRQARAARAIAEAYFGAEQVLGRLLAESGLG